MRFPFRSGCVRLSSFGSCSTLQNAAPFPYAFEFGSVQLIKPSYINTETGYRYYSHEQLLKIEMIRWFKHLDVSLQEIASLLRCKDPQIFAAFCGVQKQNALAKRRALDWAIHKLEISKALPPKACDMPREAGIISAASRCAPYFESPALTCRRAPRHITFTVAPTSICVIVISKPPMIPVRCPLE